MSNTNEITDFLSTPLMGISRDNYRNKYIDFTNSIEDSIRDSMEKQIPKIYKGNQIKIKYKLPSQAKHLHLDDIQKIASKIVYRICDFNDWTAINNYITKKSNGCFSYYIYGGFTLILKN